MKSLAWGGSIAALGYPVHRIHAAPAEYSGKLLVVLQMDGGWDVTSLCDPKTNQPGEQDINNWARSADIQSAGNINYAPIARNARLFDRYYRDMLVINGVDAQTNSHTTGVLHNWSGRSSEGLPTLTALFAAQRAPDLPLSYVNFGGFAHSANLIRYSRLDNTEGLLNLLDPTIVPWDRERQIRSQPDIDLVRRYRRKALQRKLADDTLTPRQRDNILAHQQAVSTQDSLKRLESILPPPEQIQQEIMVPGTDFYSNLLRQMQLTLLTFKAGIGCASDLLLGGFDTHTNHDVQHEGLFGHFADGIDFFWNYANELGIAQRITLVVGSDFGRTPHYNADAGKDHWPIGSYIVMEQDAPWGNRVIGATDGGHNALRINPSSLQRDDRNGTLIYPKHIHQALRRHLGIEGFAASQGMTLTNTEDFALFDPGKQT